jgi:hypothetical protein
MKKIYLTFACIAFSLVAIAQTVLRFETHGLVADHTNEMKITTYVEPGEDGKNVVWDFRELKLNKDFVGMLDNPNISKGANLFPESNTRLEEFGNSFFFRTTQSGIEQFGFLSANGSTNITYDKPFVKMRYPFSFGSSYTGTFSGSYNTNEKHLGDLAGSYAVEGDGLGTLMLPSNMVYDNVLRVKETKSYEQILNNRNYNIETITYRWYTSEHRFPILVLINATTTYQDGRTFTSTQAAYNPIALNKPANQNNLETNGVSSSLATYPNPYHSFVNITFNLADDSEVNLSVYDVTGKLVKVLHTGSELAGEKHYTFSAKEINLSSGAYIVRLNVNGEETSRRILEL